MKVFLLSLFLFAAPVKAETLIYSVSDLLFEIPNFSNAPTLNLNEALQGNVSFSNIQKLPRKERKELERKLIRFLWEEFPNAQSISIWNGNVLIRI